MLYVRHPRPPKQHCCYWPTTGPSKWRRMLPKRDSWNRRLHRHPPGKLHRLCPWPIYRPGTSPRSDTRQPRRTGVLGSFGHVRRHVLQNIPCLTVVKPPPGSRDKRLSNSEREFVTCLATNEQRRLCDCQMCIGHAWELTQQQHLREPLFLSGIRLLTLPAIHVTSSSADQRRRQAAFYQQHPEQVVVMQKPAAACTSCQ